MNPSHFLVQADTSSSNCSLVFASVILLKKSSEGSLIWIMMNKYYAVLYNAPKCFVRFMHLFGLGDPDNERYFGTL